MRRGGRSSAKHLVPRGAGASPEALNLARRRYGTLWLISMPMTALHLPVSLFDRGSGLVSLAAEFGLLALQCTMWRICRMPRLSAERALELSLWVGVPHAWLVSVVVHFAPGAHVTQFSMVLLQVIIAALAVPVRAGLLIPILLIDSLAQPIMAMLAVRLGYLSASVRELVVSWLGAAFVFALSAGAARLINEMRRDLTREMGSYSLVSLIARGGMGEVWEGRHRFLARPAAIKLVTLDRAEANEQSKAQRSSTRLKSRSITSGASDRLQRFEQEAQATALLMSPHTVRLYDFGVSEGGRPYYVMELLSGFDFQTLVDRFGPLPPERVIHLMRQVCDSLGEAHAAQLVHRDLKPSNIFLVERGLTRDLAKVLDFGLLSTFKISSSTSGVLSSLGHDRAIVGTPAYFTPEHALGTRIDARSDLYQLGCIMYFLLSGRPVFLRNAPVAYAMAHLNDAPMPLSELDPSIPAQLDELVLHCLEKNPELRPQSAEELAQGLAEVPLEEPWSRERAVSWWREHGQSVAVKRPSIRDALRRRTISTSDGSAHAPPGAHA